MAALAAWLAVLRPGRPLPRTLTLAAMLLLAVAGTARAFVDDPDTVDALQALPEHPVVVMVIVQDRPWGPETRTMIGNKLGSYLRYALGGQLVRDWPDVAGKPVRIALVSEAAPGEDDVETLTIFRDQVAAAGIELVWGLEADLTDMVSGQ